MVGPGGSIAWFLCMCHQGKKKLRLGTRLCEGWVTWDTAKSHGRYPCDLAEFHNSSSSPIGPDSLLGLGWFFNPCVPGERRFGYLLENIGLALNHLAKHQQIYTYILVNRTGNMHCCVNKFYGSHVAWVSWLPPVGTITNRALWMQQEVAHEVANDWWSERNMDYLKKSRAWIKRQ